MAQEHPSKLSFSIEESVWLNKGEEIEEIVGMSLEPEITIEEQSQHVVIKGGLRLIGEYRSSRHKEGDGEEELIEEQTVFRSVEELSVAEDGTGRSNISFRLMSRSR